MQWEAGERINNIELGDFAHWLVHTSLVGTQMQGSYQIAIKPKDYNIATDMVVTTNQRSYHVGLVSHKGSATHVMNFYYPEETLQLAIAKAKATSHQAIQPNIIDNHTHINALQLHFNYQLQGCKPAWRPVRVFDDGDKTFIEMPPIAERLDLPVLYIEREKGMQLINYRYRRPYYIVDALFKRAYLITGKGRKQTKVIIDNNNIKA